MAPTLNGLLAVWIFTLNIDAAFSMDITVPTDPVYGNMGSSVDLPCKYSTSTIEKGFNVEWRFAAPGTLPINAKRMLYFDGQLYQINSLRGRMQLLQDPPTGGIASVRIIDLQPSDSGVYICEVINPGDWSGTGLGVINLTVLMPPSPPECRVTGNTLVGNDVTLSCHSSQGVPQPIYTWTREKTAAQIPVPEANMVQDQLSGSLLLRNLSYAFNGAFQCRASNEIGAASCTVNIRVSTSNAGVVAGAVMGALLFLLLLAGLAGYVFWYRKNHPKTPTVGNDIREDAVAPSFKTPRHDYEETESHLLSRSLDRHETASHTSSRFTAVV
ncbi:V-set and immunoglobulin domain-containing protein 2-like isoform X2 [Huso huso]